MKKAGPGSRFAGQLRRRLKGAVRIAVVGVGEALSPVDRLGMDTAREIGKQQIPGVCVFCAGTVPESHGHMSLYSRVKPLVNASKPAGEWQSMEAILVGNRVTVMLNGQKVQDNIVIEGITGGALDSNEGLPGPLMIQGDHGRIWVRKVVLTPIK